MPGPGAAVKIAMPLALGREYFGALEAVGHRPSWRSLGQAHRDERGPYRPGVGEHVPGVGDEGDGGGDDAHNDLHQHEPHQKRKSDYQVAPVGVGSRKFVASWGRAPHTTLYVVDRQISSSDRAYVSALAGNSSSTISSALRVEV
jgi:hypothetical protein